MVSLLSGAKRLFGATAGNSQALSSRRTLVSPQVRSIDVAFENFRARLAKVDPARQSRILGLVLLRARARLDVELLRSVADLAPDRAMAVKLTVTAARHDKAFREHTTAGDRARDRRDWSAGAEAYAKALQLFPRHNGYLVQLGHCCKEQQHYALAEIAYRDAIAFGASVDDVWQHLEHVVLCSGGSARVYPLEIVEALTGGDREQEVAALTTSAELVALAWLLHGKSSLDAVSTVRFLRLAPRRAELSAQLLADPAFLSANRRLVAFSGRALAR